MVFVTTSGSSLCISPWKDGLTPQEIVRHSNYNIHSVLVIFPENDNAENDRSILSERDLIKLFQVIANDMPSVRSITISGGSYAQPGRSSKIRQGSRIVPPLKAITSLLRGRGGHLLALSLVQIRLLGSERDFRDLNTAISQHPTLQSFDCSGCVFETRTRSNTLRDTCRQKRMLHFMFDGGFVLEEDVWPEEEEEDEEEEGFEEDMAFGHTNASDDSAWESITSFRGQYLCFCV